MNEKCRFFKQCQPGSGANHFRRTLRPIGKIHGGIEAHASVLFGIADNPERITPLLNRLYLLGQ
jgi:hypothetical protein